jgi:hypothetical protein
MNIKDLKSKWSVFDPGRDGKTVRHPERCFRNKIFHA